MKKYEINGKIYEWCVIVEFDDAIKESGFYFERARNLNLHAPWACVVIADQYKTKAEELLIGKYHLAFEKAQVNAAKNKKYEEELIND